MPFLPLAEIKPADGGVIAVFLLMGGMSALAAFLSLFVYWEIAAGVIVGFAMHGEIPDIMPVKKRAPQVAIYFAAEN
ncbi:MAG: hypothetical protein ACR2P5_05750 [Gammaproteobacteria bacterium]